MPSYDTSFTSYVTNIVATWLQAVNDRVFKGRNPIYVTSTGAADAQIVTLTAPSLASSLAAGDEFTFNPGYTNSGALTVEVVGAASLGVKAVQWKGAALTGGEVQAGVPAHLVYDGTQFQLLNNMAVLPLAGGTLSGDLALAAAKVIVFEGTTDNAFETTLSGGDPTADRTFTLPDKTGTGVVASDMQDQSYQRFTTGGTSTAYTLTPTPAITANAAGQRFRAVFHAAAGASPTMAISGQAALNLKYKDSTGAKQAISSTQIPADWAADIENDGTDLVVLNTASAAGASGKLGTKGVGVLKAGGINIPQNDDRWLNAIGEASSASIAGRVRFNKFTRISDLHVKLSAAVAGGESIVITVQRNDEDTAATCTISAGGTTGSDTTNTVDFQAGEWISFKAVTSATFGSTTDLGLSVKLTGEDGAGAGIIPYRGGAGTTFEYTESSSGAAASLSSILTDLCMPECKLLLSDYAGSSYLVPRLNDVVPANAQYIFSAEHRSFSADDLYNVYNNSTSPSYEIAVSTAAMDDDYYAPCFLTFTSYSQAQNTTRYAAGYGSGDASATESDVQFPMPACTVKNLRVCSNTVVAAGQNAVVTIRKNGVDTGVTCTLTNASRISSDLVNSVAFAAGDLLTVSVVPSATAGTHTYNILVETEETP